MIKLLSITNFRACHYIHYRFIDVRSNTVVTASKYNSHLAYVQACIPACTKACQHVLKHVCEMAALKNQAVSQTHAAVCLHACVLHQLFQLVTGGTVHAAEIHYIASLTL